MSGTGWHCGSGSDTGLADERGNWNVVHDDIANISCLDLEN